MRRSILIAFAFSLAVGSCGGGGANGLGETGATPAGPGGSSAGGSGQGASGGSSSSGASGGGGLGGGGAGGLGGAGNGGASGATSVAGAGGFAGSSSTGGAAGTGGVGGGAAGGPLGDHFWTLEALGAPITIEECTIAEGQKAFVDLVETTSDSCHHGGPVNVDVDPAAMTITLHAWDWIEHGVACLDSEGVEPRHVVIEMLTTGAWTVKEAVTGATALLTVGGPPPPNTCVVPGPEGAKCELDCDCDTGSGICVPGVGVGMMCGSACGHPCDVDLDCAPTSICGMSSLATPLCTPRTMDECTSDANCPPGMTCPPVSEGPRACVFGQILNAASRHACSDQSDCDPGLECVDEAGQRTCETICFTQGMRCPVMHACQPQASISAARWVCEWLGE